MTIINVLKDNTDEVIAVVITVSYVMAWFLHNPMPTEPLMIILGYYFGKKAGTP